MLTLQKETLEKVLADYCKAEERNMGSRGSFYYFMPVMLSDFLNHMKISLLLKKKCLTYIAKQQVKAKINKILK